MKISVALCTYNGAKFLQMQLDSIASQSHVPDEVVIFDDVSSDDSLEIAERFSRISPFVVKIHRNQENLGSSKNFEQAVSSCNGDIIVLSDQDDIWHAEKLDVITSSFSKCADLGLLFSDAFLIDAQGHRLARKLWGAVGFAESSRRALRAKDQFSMLLRGNFITGATVAFRAEWKGLVLPIPDGWAHDYWISLLLAAASRIDFVDRPLISYRCHSDQERGVKEKGLRAMWCHFRTLDDKNYLEAAEMRKQIAERLRVYDPELFATAILKCESMVVHLLRRGRLPRERLLRAGTIIQEIGNGNYFRHSSGVKSILRDLIATY